MTRFLFVAALLAVSIAPAEARDRRVLELVDMRSGDTLRIRPFERLGRPSRRAAALLGHAMASRSGAVRPIHPRLVRLLVQLQRHFGGPRIVLLSAYRSARDPGGPHGYHGVGQAADIRVDGVAPRAVFEYCRRLGRSGCGLYPSTGFVHVDARPRSTVWVDLSTGRGSEYVSGVDAWLAQHPEAGRGGAR